MSEKGRDKNTIGRREYGEEGWGWWWGLNSETIKNEKRQKEKKPHCRNR